MEQRDNSELNDEAGNAEARRRSTSRRLVVGLGAAWCFPACRLGIEAAHAFYNGRAIVNPADCQRKSRPGKPAGSPNDG